MYYTTTILKTDKEGKLNHETKYFKSLTNATDYIALQMTICAEKGELDATIRLEFYEIQTED